MVAARALVEVAVGGELEAVGAPAVLALELGLEHGHDEEGHLVQKITWGTLSREHSLREREGASSRVRLCAIVKLF